MSQEIADKTKKETYHKCTHCKDEIFWNTHKKLTSLAGTLYTRHISSVR